MAAILKNKNLNIFEIDWPILTKLCILIRLDPLDPQLIKFCEVENLRWCQPPSWKILISLQPTDRFQRSLACWCVLTHWTPSANKISQCQNSKMAVAAIFKNHNISAMDQPISTNLVMFGDVPWSSSPSQQIKFYAFKNSTWCPIAI